MPLLSTSISAPTDPIARAPRGAARRCARARRPAAVIAIALLLALVPVSAYGSSPPTSTSPPTISGTGLVGETLTADDGKFVGDPDPTISRQWQRCDRSGRACEPIDSETEPTYVIADEDVGGTLRVAVTATNTDEEDSWISFVPPSTEGGGGSQFAEDTTNETFTVTVFSDPFAVPEPSAPPEPAPAAPAPVVPAPAVLTPTILSLSQPHVQCTTLARLIKPGTPGPLAASGAVSGTLTIRAARREVLRVATSSGDVELYTGRRVLARADDVGGLGWGMRSSRRLALRSGDGRLLIAIGRNAHHPTRTVIKARLCTALAPARERVDVRADQTLRATVYATAPDGTPIANLPLAASAVGTSLRVVTDTNGRARVWLPAGGRRDLHVDFAGDATRAPAALSVPIASAATSTLTLVSGVLPVRAAAEFAGRLAGRDGNPAGTRITLSRRTLDGSWRTAGRGLADARGNWTITSPLSPHTPGRPVAAYRVLVEPGPAYPYVAALGSPTTFHAARGRAPTSERGASRAAGLRGTRRAGR